MRRAWPRVTAKDKVSGTDYGIGSRHLISSKAVIYPAGYGYEVTAGAKAEAIEECVADWLDSRRSDLAWAVTNFAARSASELELLATIVYADREMAGQPGRRQLQDLAQRVRVVKPRFLESYMLAKCRKAQQMGLLSSPALA